MAETPKLVFQTLLRTVRKIQSIAKSNFRSRAAEDGKFKGVGTFDFQKMGEDAK